MGAIKSIAGMMGANMQTNSVNKKTATNFADKIRSAGQIPDSQYDYHYRTMLGMLQKGDVQGATDYMKFHRGVAGDQTQKFRIKK